MDNKAHPIATGAPDAVDVDPARDAPRRYVARIAVGGAVTIQPYADHLEERLRMADSIVERLADLARVTAVADAPYYSIDRLPPDCTEREWRRVVRDRLVPVRPIGKRLVVMVDDWTVHVRRAPARPISKTTPITDDDRLRAVGARRK